jgi:predicted nucleic acid-binding protein
MIRAAPLVIDTSAAIAIARDEPRGADAARIIRGASVDGRIVVPSHFWLEVMNPLLTRYRVAGGDVIRAIHELDRFGIETIDVDRPLVLSTLDIAERHGLTAYDATYLALAIAVDGRLLTFDEALSVAAGARAIPTGEEHRTADLRPVYEHDVTWPNYKEASAYLAELRAETVAGRATD